MGSLRKWTVASGIVEQGESILLVENLRRSGMLDWSTPGGVVEPGEQIVEGLTREVFEETGLTVAGWVGPIYTVTTVAVQMGWALEVEVFRAASWQGELSVGQDPDGIVVAAVFCDLEELKARLAPGARWVAEPLLSWLAEPWEGTRAFSYEVSGTNRTIATVTRNS